jgi:hypothetical protein
MDAWAARKFRIAAGRKGTEQATFSPGRERVAMNIGWLSGELKQRLPKT